MPGIRTIELDARILSFLPFNVLLGFCKDYQRVIVNTCYESIIIQAQRQQLP